MDNNPNPTPAPANQTPQEPTPVANIVQEPPVSSGSNKMWIIAIIVILILIVGGLYWYMNNQKTPAPTSQTIPSPVTSTQNVDSLDKDLNASTLDDVDKEFSSVDSDLGSL